MKYIIGFIATIGIVLIFVFCPMNNIGKETKNEYLRIHIRANSNSQIDQNVKYKVKDSVVDALIPLLSDIDDFEEAKVVMSQNLKMIEEVANKVLLEEGFSYTSRADIDNEYFPTRTYDALTLEEGFYDALIIRLGSGEGDNWWCLVYPAFCFTSSTNSNNVVYISKIWEKLKVYSRRKL